MIYLQGKCLCQFNLCNGVKSYRERICSLKSRHHCGRAISSREANSKSHKLFPFDTVAEKDGGVPIELKL